MKEYKCLQFDANSEAMLGLLSMLGFDSFEEKEDQLHAYIESDLWIAELKDQVDHFSTNLGLSYQVSDLPNINWNEKWESNFKPVEVDDFCRIRADFHEPSTSFEHEIVINPKMAFGTGHHETTFMMIQSMRKIGMDGLSVFDYGCGTGVLAILAKMMQADYTFAIDIEEESYLNTIENAKINHVELDAKQGVLADCPPQQYDVILANINRQVLLDSAESLLGRLGDSGVLLLSGILKQDYELVSSKYRDSGFVIDDSMSRGDWMCVRLSKG